MDDYPGENTLLVKQAFQKATGASIHKAHTLIGTYRITLIMVDESESEQELKEYKDKLVIAESKLKEFVNNG
jgi:hypothetical protein